MYNPYAPFTTFDHITQPSSSIRAPGISDDPFSTETLNEGRTPLPITTPTFATAPFLIYTACVGQPPTRSVQTYFSPHNNYLYAFSTFAATETSVPCRLVTIQVDSHLRAGTLQIGPYLTVNAAGGQCVVTKAWFSVNTVIARHSCVNASPAISTLAVSHLPTLKHQSSPLFIDSLVNNAAHAPGAPVPVYMPCRQHVLVPSVWYYWATFGDSNGT